MEQTAEKKDFKKALKEFKENNKNSPIEITTQKVIPIQDKSQEMQLTVWIPKNLMKELKSKGIESDRTIKEMTILALEKFLEK